MVKIRSPKMLLYYFEIIVHKSIENHYKIGIQAAFVL